MFNLAAIYTQIGCRHDRKLEKGLDDAVYSFLQAAGVFKHIYDTFTNAPSMDLKPLVSLMKLVICMMVLTKNLLLRS